MAASPFRLGWFGNLTTPEWRTGWSNDALSWTDARYYVDMVRDMERAGFDFMMLEDSLMVSDIYAGTAELELKHAMYAPKLDPVPVISMLAYATEHIGIVGTASTTFYPPYLLARTFSTLDHVTRGRVGWNIVTSSEDRAAQNFGMDKLPEHDLRYEIAEEFVEVVTALWDSWAPDAVVADPISGYYADHTKVAPIHHEGKHFSVRGPLNTPRSPQGRPVICQAGASPRGRDFAAKNADMLLCIPNGLDGMKEYRDDIRARAAAHGRDPDDIKVFFVVAPIIGRTMEEAQAKEAAFRADKQRNFEKQMVHFGAIMEIDFSVLDPDLPIPDDVTTNGHQGTFEGWKQAFGGRTIKDAASDMRVASMPLVGTPDHIADEMDKAMEHVGGDGFMFLAQPTSREYIREITEGLCPALRRRGLIRTGFAHEHFRDNMRSFD
ncbi:NtaA/DmoA family FMN-dependent monooxygenase [Pseudonocardia oroxyli]|uniref:FMN-dependent oxidoreductase, nitrilotriacetate monooxygenase family n=1 Tax=Pseudonocardia oroxyli TaxID=366584 RepID=A0A1G7ZEY8_PSEOR|nr:NtaA/DmoA family FMN-dependent monooxygenase [Pseudonocardia oroxyli]SDH07301.1 FMN-dependent oxidoreductase, nitrilotriacetate monooxygenase family [Pseudonocardia oroxyli]